LCQEDFTDYMKINKPRILFVHDDLSWIRLAREEMEEEGYEIVGAINGEMGIRLLHEKGPFDIIVTDLHMPVMDGFKLAEIAKEVDHDIRIILFSAEYFGSDEFMPFIDAHIVCSADLSELKDTIKFFIKKNLKKGEKI